MQTAMQTVDFGDGQKLANLCIREGKIGWPLVSTFKARAWHRFEDIITWAFEKHPEHRE
jgi:hypothetical protein